MKLWTLERETLYSSTDLTRVSLWILEISISWETVETVEKATLLRMMGPMDVLPVLSIDEVTRSADLRIVTCVIHARRASSDRTKTVNSVRVGEVGDTNQAMDGVVERSSACLHIKLAAVLAAACRLRKHSHEKERVVYRIGHSAYLMLVSYLRLQQSPENRVLDGPDSLDA